MSTQRRVLAVDDEPILLMDLKLLLVDEGFEPGIAKDSQEARRLASEMAPEIVLVDLRLGTEDGIDVVADLRQLVPESVFVVMSAYADTESTIRAMQTGAHDFLVKPFVPQDLRLVLNRSVQRLELTEQKLQAEESLRSSNQELSRMNNRLRHVVETITQSNEPAGDPTGRLLEEFADVMGAKGGSLFMADGDSMKRLHALGPDHSPTSLPLPPAPDSVLGRVLATKQPVIVKNIHDEEEIDGSGWPGYRDASLMSFPLITSGGRVEGVVNLHDLAEQGLLSQDLDLGVIFSSLVLQTIHTHRAYAEVEARERRFSALINNASDIITIVDSEKTILYDSPSMETILGYGPKERVGRSLADFVHPDDLELISRCCSLKDPNQPKQAVFQARFALDTGEWHTFEINASDRRDDPDVEGIVFNARDVTSRLEAESSLRDSEHKYHELFEHSPALMILVGTDMMIQEVNQTFVETLGYARGKVIGRDMLALVSPESGEYLGRYWDHMVAGHPVPAVEHQIRAKDGKTHILRIREGVRHRIMQGDQVMGIMSELIDVTDLRIAQRREREQREELYQASKLASLGTLLSGVAHEINNPNNFIRMSVDNLRDFWRDAQSILDSVQTDGRQLILGGIPYDRSREMVAKMISSARDGSERIERLVTDLKNFARKGDAREYAIVDLNTVLSTAANMVGSSVRAVTSHFELNLSPEPVMVLGNSQQIEQVVMNLITNASHALTDRSQSLRVSLTVSDREPWVELRVTDEGIGMSNEVMTQITDPFFTTRRSDGGTGLGLSVSHRIVSDHGGTMVFESAPGAGTTAIVRLPLYKRGRSGSGEQTGG